MKQPLPAYQGEEAYAFVSYAHADSKHVFNDVRWLQDQGLNIWYDEGITPGERWTDVLADRISNSSLVLYMVTTQSVRSDHCRNEIDLAIESERPLLLVHLEPAELASGQKLTLNSRQAIIKYQISNDEYSRKLADAVSIKLGEEIDPHSIKPVPKVRNSKKIAAISFAGLLLLGTLGYFSTQSTTPVVQREEPLPILISDFYNTTGEAVFDDALEDALRVSLQAAPFIDAFDRKTASKASNDLTGSAELSEENARLIATREDLSLVVTGAVTKTGDGYELSIDAKEPVSGVVRADARASADSRVDVLAKIAEMATELRRELGDVKATADSMDETFSTNSLEALSLYTQAQKLAADWQHQQASELYEQAVTIDPNFARAYSGWAYSALELGQSRHAEELFEKTISKLGNTQERERLRTLGLYYSQVSGNNQKAAEKFQELLEKYPSDTASLNNLAVISFFLRDFAGATAAGKKLVERFPEQPLYLGNYALFNMYASNFEAAVTASEQTLEVSPEYYVAHLPIAVDHALRFDYRGALATYDRMAEISDRASREALLGKADIALARGDNDLATSLLKTAISQSESSGDTQTQIRAEIWLATVLHRLNQTPAATGRLKQIDLADQKGATLLLMGEAYAELGDADRVTQIVERLQTDLNEVSTAYAETLEAISHLATSRLPDAVRLLQSSTQRADLWQNRLLLGQAYLADGRAVEAMDEFENCWARRGEGAAVFLDDIPSVHRVTELFYWQGRAAQDMGLHEQAVRHFEEFMEAADRAEGSSKYVDAKQRIASLNQR